MSPNPRFLMKIILLISVCALVNLQSAAARYLQVAPNGHIYEGSTQNQAYAPSLPQQINPLGAIDTNPNDERIANAEDDDEDDDDDMKKLLNSDNFQAEQQLTNSRLANQNQLLPLASADLKTSASHHKHHGHHAKGWLDMGAWTGKKGSFGWYDKHPVGKGK